MSRWSATIRPGTSPRTRAERSVPRATVERIVRPCSMPGKTRSSAYLAAPVALPMPSLRGTLVPTEAIVKPSKGSGIHDLHVRDRAFRFRRADRSDARPEFELCRIRSHAPEVVDDG